MNNTQLAGDWDWLGDIGNWVTDALTIAAPVVGAIFPPAAPAMIAIAGGAQAIREGVRQSSGYYDAQKNTQVVVTDPKVIEAVSPVQGIAPQVMTDITAAQQQGVGLTKGDLTGEIIYSSIDKLVTDSGGQIAPAALQAIVEEALNSLGTGRMSVNNVQSNILTKLNAIEAQLAQITSSAVITPKGNLKGFPMKCGCTKNGITNKVPKGLSSFIPYIGPAKEYPFYLAQVLGDKVNKSMDSEIAYLTQAKNELNSALYQLRAVKPEVLKEFADISTVPTAAPTYGTTGQEYFAEIRRR